MIEYINIRFSSASLCFSASICLIYAVAVAKIVALLGRAKGGLLALASSTPSERILFGNL